MSAVDGKIYQILTTLWDIMYMGLLWTLFSLPLVTIGASTTALYYIATKKVTDREGSYMIQDFWTSFKENFVQSTVSFLLLVAVGIMVLYNFILLAQMELGSFGFIVRLALIFVTIQLIFIITTIFAVIARFDLTLMPAFKASFALANKHLFSTVVNVAILLALIYITLRIPVIILFSMSTYCYFASFSLVRIFKKNNTEFEEYIDRADIVVTKISE